MEWLEWLVSRPIFLILSLLQILTFAFMALGGLYEERQFIIVPGETNVTVSNMTTSDGKIENYWLECNKGTKIHVFDTYDWEFKSEFNPDNKGSKVPPPIVKLIGGNDTGGATLNLKPTSGWGTPALGAIFSRRNQLLPDLQILPFTTNFPSEPSSEAQNTEKSNKGAIIGGAIGGVIGGICVVALVISALMFLRKRRKSRQDKSRAELQGGNLAAELQAANLRLELQENHKNTPHELPSPLPQEVSVGTGGHYVPEKSEEQEMVFIDRTSPPLH